jgi:AcrR family transcriptional regulator
VLNEVRWEEILRVAAEVFLEKGYQNTTVREIAGRAGLLNQGSLYYYIETKEDLLFALLERGYALAVDTLVEDEATAAADAPARLAAFIRRWIETVVLGDNPAAVANQELRSLSPARLKTIGPMADACTRFVRQLLDQGIADGDFDSSLDRTIAVHNIFYLLNNTYRWYRPSGRLSAEEVVDWYTTFIIGGLGAHVYRDRDPAAMRQKPAFETRQ